MLYSHKTILILVITLMLLFSYCILSATPYVISPLLKSALLPGWGQLSIDRSYGYGMLTSEALIWSSYFYNSNEQKLKDRQSYEHALKFAHINPGDYPSQYYRDLAKYDTSGFSAGGYNAMIRTTAQSLFPDNLAAQQQYIDANAIPDEMSWQWDDFTYRRKYASMRNQILELKDQAQIITGLVIANHLISTIDMLRLRKHWANVHTSVQYYRNTPVLNLCIDF
jgi:hypothetical protein